MPVAIPKRERQIIKPSVASPRVLTDGGSSGEVLGNLISNVPKNAIEQPTKSNAPLSMATTAAAVTEAERLGAESIGRLYNTSRRGAEEGGESNAKQKRSLTFAFFSPKVPVEKICKRRRAHGSNQTAKRGSRLSRGV